MDKGLKLTMIFVKKQQQREIKVRLPLSECFENNLIPFYIL